MSPEENPLRLEALLIAALGGDKTALATLADRENVDDLASGHRLVGALGLRLEPYLTPSQRVPWQDFLRSETARSLLLEAHLQQIGHLLGTASIPWMVFKGMDLRHRAYEHPAERPVSDIDILLDPEGFTTARTLLREAGWQDTLPLSLNESFILEEGYCWNGRWQDGTYLEVHFRLWGMVPEGFASAVLEGGLAAPELGPTARRPQWSDAYLLAAVHLWMNPSPASLLSWWDLEKIACLAPSGWAGEVAEAAHRWDLQLPVTLAAAVAQGWWPESGHGACEALLRPKLGLWEKRLFESSTKKRTGHRVSLKQITLRRLFSGRKSRGGWKTLLRAWWSHPGIVERETDPGRPWILRRLSHVLGRFQRHLG